MVAPKYVKQLTASKSVPLIMTFGGLSTSLPMSLVSLMLIVRPNSLQACENLLSSSRSSSAVWLTNAVSPANSSSQLRIVLTLVFGLNFAKLNSLPSGLVCREIPSWKSWNAFCRSVEKKIPNSVGARTHPCFTPLVILKGWDEVQSKLIVLWVFSWKDDIMLRSVGGHPIFFKILNHPSLLTKSKALVRSMKAMYSGLHCSLQFSCSCLRKKTMSIVDLPALM